MRIKISLVVLLSIALLLFMAAQRGEQAILTPAPASSSGPVYVNSWAGGNNQCSTATCDLTISPSAGHTLRVVGEINTGGTITVTSFKDSAGNNLSQIYLSSLIGGHYQQFDYCEASIPSGLTKVELITSSNANAQMVVYELSGVGCTADGASNSTAESSGGTITSPSITPGTGDAIAVISQAIGVSGASFATCTAGAGYSNLIKSGTSNNDGIAVCAEFEGVASASGSYAVLMTYTLTTVTYNANIAATK